MKTVFDENFSAFIEDKGFDCITERVKEAAKSFIFDGVLFKNSEHKSKFYLMYGKYAIRTGRRPNNKKTAVMYILSANRFFYPFLDAYITVPEVKLESSIKSSVNEEIYNLYHAARKVADQKSGLRKKDITEEGIIKDRTLCIILNAMYLKENGLMCGCDECMKPQKDTKKAESKRENRKSNGKKQKKE